MLPTEGLTLIYEDNTFIEEQQAKTGDVSNQRT
jgi:hypothetical protein